MATNQRECRTSSANLRRRGASSRRRRLTACAIFAQVDMKNFDMNVILNIASHEIDVLLALTPVSMHHRHLVDFGPTTLRCTIAYNMLRLCRLRPGEIECCIDLPYEQTQCRLH